MITAEFEEYFIEGLFNNYTFICTNKQISRASGSTTYESPRKAVRSPLEDLYGKINREYSNTSLTYYDTDNPVYINKKFERELEKEYYLYKVDKNKNVSLIASDSLEVLCSKYGTKIEIVDTGRQERDRKELLTNGKKIFSEELSKVKKKYDIYDAITSVSGDKENIDSFISGVSNEVTIGDYDIWKIAKRVNLSPRSGDFPSDFNDASNELIRNCSERLKRYNGKLDYSGDWDEGPIIIEYIG